jgi:phosphonate transport system substrate-binding protein
MSTIRFATFLSPVLYETYEHITRFIGERVGCPVSLSIGNSLEEFTNGQVDIGFLCGLLYTHMLHWPSCPVELLAAPILQPARYQGSPIYFSDVIVPQTSPFTSFDDLAGCTWAYNERASHSGYNLVCYSLLERGKTLHYFSNRVQTGAHSASLQAVLEGRAHATAIDSHLLDVLLTTNKQMAAHLRIIDTFGPSAIPPLVIAKRVDKGLKLKIQEALFSMHHDPRVTEGLRAGLIDRLVPVTDAHYQSLWHMFSHVREKDFAL